MTRTTTLALAALLALASGASAAEPAGKGVGALGCVRPIVPGTRHTWPAYFPRNDCRVHTARFADGWCGRTVSDAKVWPWAGPAMSLKQAYYAALAASYGRDGC